MRKNGKIILLLVAFTLFTIVTAKFLIVKSDEIAPTFYVVVAKSEIKVGDSIAESSIEPVIVPASLVKSQAFYWSTDGIDSEKSEINSAQIQKVVGKTATKAFYRGDQITVIGIK